MLLLSTSHPGHTDPLVALFDFVKTPQLTLYHYITVWCQEPVSNLVDGGELRSAPELNNVVGKRHQLPPEGRDRGSLLLP